ncbi:SDR family NAD(P)-dependent oxidoreductase [Frigoribacterium sp. UYMn621]|uniref:SDR family NAD(P)-dependent oxidoreductase n=1 Tax=Frigoribacterium sp. UYMn621 TaxID=3156343 RepID=UPI00339966AF
MSGASAELSGRVMVITGASSGLGRAAAIELSTRGATVAVVGRNAERTRAVAERVGGFPFTADFDSLAEVRTLAEELLASYPRIDVLANNAGGLVGTRGLSADGHERTFQHNHLAPFLLTNLLLDRLAESAGRVISTASGANMFSRLDLDDLDWKRRAYAGGWLPYGTSKLETIMFIRELAQRTAGSGVDAYSFHPGFVATGFGADSALLKFGQFISRGSLGISPEQGAAPLIHLAAERGIVSPSGTYFDGLKPDGRERKQASDGALCRELWEKSARMVGLPD